MMHLAKNKFKTLLMLIKLLRKNQVLQLLMLAMIKTKVHPLLLVMKVCILKTKVIIPVKTGTQMIKMIKRYLQDAIEISKPVVKQELQEILR